MRRTVPLDAGWRERYRDMVATPAEAAARVRPGQRVFIGTGCGAPAALVEALVARSGELADVEIVHLLATGDAPYADRGLTDCFLVNSFFIGESVRSHIQEGLGDYTPIMLVDIPRLFNSGQIPLDVVLIQTTPPDQAGKVSLGISVDVARSAAENGSLVVAQVNPRMPRTLGDSRLDVADLDLLVPAEREITEVAPLAPTETSRRIGEFIAGLVDDGATVEFGIGRIPQAVIERLRDRRDLGVHTEMLTDGIIDLVESGAVTGARKTLDRGLVVTSFCMGTRRLYDFVAENPAFAFRPTEYVNDPGVIARQHRMVAINTALEIDLTGQVCADSIGGRFFSGIGGQVDFNRGAARSPGGKPIIALPSTARGGEVSRIVTRLSPGAGVVTTRGAVHYVVTEHGVAYLHGKSIQARALALIGIAHPRFRDQLFREAIEAGLLRRELAQVGDRLVFAAPEMRTSFALDDGTQIALRPVHPTDEPGMRGLHYALSKETVSYRFMTTGKRFPHREIMSHVYVDHRRDVAIVATVPAAHGEEIVALGRYYLDERSNRAEVAFVVRDDWQGRGIGTALFRHLLTLARRAGIAGFTAEVLRGNRRMAAVFNHSGLRVSSRLADDVTSFEMDFS